MAQSVSAVVVVATLQPLPGREAEVEKACREAVRAIHTEPGCERFALHRIADGSGGFAFIERWESADSLREHAQLPAYAELGAKLDGALVGPPQIMYLEPVPDGDPRLGEV